MKKCGTPLHREIFDLFLDSIMLNFKLYCDPGSTREGKQGVFIYFLNASTILTLEIESVCKKETV